ncbi:MAG: hypothetical protein KA313_10415 [Pseudarcicella sp.]|nr:hypothetical protein [Pseudarcicella sp.]
MLGSCASYLGDRANLQTSTRKRNSRPHILANCLPDTRQTASQPKELKFPTAPTM